MTSELHVTRIAHSCHLIELGSRTILTDPWFAVTSTYDPGEAVARSVAQLPELDAVVITHEPLTRPIPTERVRPPAY